VGTTGQEAVAQPPYTFAGHQTFALRSGWLKKGYDAIQDAGSEVFSQVEAIAVLGVGKNMVTSIRHWMIAAGMAVEHKVNGKVSGVEVTEFADAVLSDLGLDPYLEHSATLWLVHERLCASDSAAYTWFYTFHRWRRSELYRNKLTEAIVDSTQGFARSPSTETVARDVDCLIHTYARSRTPSEESLDSPLTSLGLVVPDFDQVHRFAVGPKPSLSAAVFAVALARYWHRQRPGARTMSATEIIFDEGAPGSTFKLDEESVFAYLEGLSDVTDGYLRFEEDGPVQQVIWDGDHLTEAKLLSLLRACYVR
jgi:hypothetical protein